MNEERRWIRAVQKRSSEKAANQLIHKYYKEMFAYVYKQVYDKETAQDLTQEIFISMLKSIGTFDGRASFRTWLYKIARSRVVDYFRSKSFKQQKNSLSLEEDLLEDDQDFTLTLERKEEVEHILFAINQLEEELQVIIRMKLFSEKRFKDIALRLQMPVATVKTKFYKALRLLKKRVKEENDGTA